jgi:hypothetical protein
VALINTDYEKGRLQPTPAGHPQLANPSRGGTQRCFSQLNKKIQDPKTVFGHFDSADSENQIDFDLP